MAGDAPILAELLVAAPDGARLGASSSSGVALVPATALFLERRDALFVALLPRSPSRSSRWATCCVRRRACTSRAPSRPPIVPAGSEAVVSLVVQNLSVRPATAPAGATRPSRGISVPESALLPSLGRHGQRRRRRHGPPRVHPHPAPPRRLRHRPAHPRSRTDPFGLAFGEQTAGVPHDLVVTPRVSAAAGNALSLTTGDGTMHELLRHTNPNSDELIAREYRPGDPLRRMNWPATARHGELMVRQEEQRSNPEARLIIDTTHSGACATGRAGASRPPGRLDSAFELALEMAASIGIHLLEAGFRLDVDRDRAEPAVAGARPRPRRPAR